MAMPTASALAWDGMLYVGTGSQGDANRPFMAVKPGAAGDITLKPDTTSNEFVRGGRAASPGTRRPRLFTPARPISSTTPGS